MPVQPGSSLPKLKPTVTTNAVTDFNQSQGTLNATVSANKYLTTVYFDYSTSASFNPGTYATVSAGTTSSQNASISSVVLSFASNTVYYVRCRAINEIGTTIGNTVNFTTWHLITYISTTAGSYSVSVPSIPGVAPTIYEMLLYGGGGGANYGGGGGGGYRLASSKLSSATGTQTVSGTIGAGGAAGNGGTGTGTATAGGNTTLTIGNTTYTAGGGGAGNHPGNCGAPFGRGGSAGTGDNTANQGGSNTYGYYTIVGYNFVCDSYNKDGSCASGHNEPIYGYNCGYYACGGGGGTDLTGQNAYTQDTASHNGGVGGNGGGAYGLNGGNGGGGYGTQSTGAAGTRVSGGTAAGTGGTSFAAGINGGVTFKYYGP